MINCISWTVFAFSCSVQGLEYTTTLTSSLFNFIEKIHMSQYSKTCVTSKDSDQPVQPPSVARVLVYPSLDSLETVEGTCAG